MLSRIPGTAYLWGSILVFAASNSIVRLLSDLGAKHPIDGRNPISFCNLLFVGNTCAVLGLLVVYRKQWTRENLRKLSTTDWISLVALALLASALAPALFFTALKHTTVTSVVLIAQLEPPLTLTLAWLILRERVSPLSWIGACLCLLGVALTALLQPSEGVFTIGRGELYVAAAAVIYAASTIISRPRITHIPLGIFTIFRNAVGAMCFFVAVLYLYGSVHFIDVASPFLWKWMLIYGGIIIVGGQIAWYVGLKTARAIDVSLATSFSPVAGILGAFLILGEQPLAAHYIGGAVIMLGIIVGLVGGRSKETAATPEPVSAPAQECGCGVGFKGV